MGVSKEEDLDIIQNHAPMLSAYKLVHKHRGMINKKYRELKLYRFMELEDLLQELILKMSHSVELALNKLKENPEYSISFLTVVVYHCHNVLRTQTKEYRRNSFNKAVLTQPLLDEDNKEVEFHSRSYNLTFWEALDSWIENIPELTPREKMIFSLRAKGLTLKDIADKVNVTKQRISVIVQEKKDIFLEYYENHFIYSTLGEEHDYARSDL